jgi:hypothetical protein
MLAYLGACLLALYICVQHYQESKRFPPGLPRYPIIGTIGAIDPEFGSKLLLDATSHAIKYGKIMGYFFGPHIR